MPRSKVTSQLRASINTGLASVPRRPDEQEIQLESQRISPEVRATGALISLTPFTATRLAYAQSTSRTRVTIAHGVGVYSLNPYAVNTSPLQAAWGSVMEPLIDADYEKRGYRGILAEPGR